MKKLAIGVTGTHGVGKTWIINDLLTRAEAVGIPTYCIISPTRYMKSLGFPNNQNLNYKLEAMCLTERIKRQKEALIEAEKCGSDKVLILSDRVGLDELSYTREAIFKEEPGSKRRFKLNEVYNLFLDWVYEDIYEYFDKVYYKPIHPDHLPVVDGDRPGELQYQSDIDEMMKYHFTVEGGNPQFEVLDPDREKASQEVWDYISKEFDVQR